MATLLRGKSTQFNSLRFELFYEWILSHSCLTEYYVTQKKTHDRLLTQNQMCAQKTARETFGVSAT